MHTQNLGPQSGTAVRILVWAALLAVCPEACRADSWTRLDPMPTARSGLAAATDLDGNVYAFGGSDLTDALDTVEVYNAVSKTWSSMSPVTGEPLAPMPTARLNFAAATGLDGTIYVLGGTDADGHALATMDAYNPYRNTWSSVARMSVPRMNLAAATDAHGRMIYAVGGANYQSGHLNTAEVYHTDPDDPAYGTWEPIASMSTKRNYPAAVCLGGFIYALAGWNLDVGDLSTMEVYDPSADAWSAAVAPLPMLGGGRLGPRAAVGPDGRI
jgi:N-acetylneuraminic acid mutarotase